MINVAIIEDNTYLLQGWKAVLELEAGLRVQGTFTSVELCLASPQISECDVLLLDISLPGMSGTDGIPELLKVNPTLAIVMVTVHEDDVHIFTALQRGAVGYLEKKVGATELINAIRDAKNGGSPMSPHIARRVINSFREARKKKDSALIKLSDREAEVLSHLVDGKSYGEIGKAVFLSADGVAYHIRNIYRKFQVNSRSEAVARAIKDGHIVLE